MMMRDEWTDRLSDYLDGELSAAPRAALEDHLAHCASCSRTLEDLRWVIGRARALEDSPPSRDLWPAIAAMVGSDPRAVRPIASGRRFSFSLPQLAIAAMLLIALSAGLAWTLHRPGVRIVAAAAAPAGHSIAVQAADNPFETTRPSPQQSYDAAVADLERVLVAGQGRLDTTTVRVVQKNLAAIDSAVAQARRAVEKDPANAYLSSYLAHTMRRKIDLLRQVAALTAAQS